MQKGIYKKLVSEYNMNPNMCLYCKKPILCKETDALSKIKRKKFCTRSCSASYNNQGIIRNNKGNYNNIKKYSFHGSILNNFTDQQLLDLYHSSNTLKEFSSKLGYKRMIDIRSKNVCKRLENLKIDFKFDKTLNKKTSYCKNCGCKLSSNNKSGYCQICYIEKRNNDKINYWLMTGDIGCTVGSTLRGCIREYIYKSQNNRCAICNNINIWNGKKMQFI